MGEAETHRRLSLDFYAQETTAVARDLLGRRLVHIFQGQRLAGLICETEAYRGSDDEASHAYRRTGRSEIMYGPAGRAYVYFIYGMHYCLNAVTEQGALPGAVLLRAILPEEGLDLMRAHRGHPPDSRLTDGPGKLCQALAIGGGHNGIDLVTDPGLFIEEGTPVPDASVLVTARIGVRGDHAARERPWRFVWQVEDR
jgi:DNA-3-methyladenine glycosylase